MAIVNDMGPCKQWLETCTDADMDGLCERYDGLYCCAILLEQVTEGIAKGCIPVPGMQGNRCMTADALHTLRSWLSLSRSVSERSVDLSHALRMKLTSTGCLWPLVMPNGPGFQK